MQINGNRVLMGKFELGKLLGQGTFGKVYYAKNVKTGQVVAIKAIDKEKVLKVGMTEQIKREISVMRLVRHPNIVQLFEVMASKTKIYFVMECVKGGELFNKVAKGKLKEDAARKYFQQLIGAVDFCHSRGVYHRDLKPENLLLDENGNLKVSDFGLSAVTQQLRQDGLLHTTCGTPAYVAPEVITRKGYDGAKADVWSCGVVLFVLMAGYLPFHDPNLMAMYKKICKGEFKCPSWFSTDVRRLLFKLLDPNPKSRITIPQLMEVPWFKKNYKPVKFEEEDDDISLEDVGSALSQNNAEASSETADTEKTEKIQKKSQNDAEASSEIADTEKTEKTQKKPTYLNAFDIISFSRGFNLSGLFEDKDMIKSERRFTSTQPISSIISKFEEVAKLLNFKVKKTDYKIKMQGSKEGRKGHLVVAAEIFQVTSSLFVVDLRKTNGDTVEFDTFCNQELKPGLKDIVWVWQDDGQ